MRDSFLHSLSSPQDSPENLIARIRANFREALRHIRWNVTSANGAPLHLLEAARSPRSGRAQGMSFLTHAGVITAFAVLAIHPTPRPGPSNHDIVMVPPVLEFSPHFLEHQPAKDPNDPSGTGGGKALLPPTAGNLPERSSIQLVKPSIPPEQERHMPIPPTILDPSAAPVLTPVDNQGLPWMKDNNRSPGPSNSNTIGKSSGSNIGDGPSGPGGGGDSASLQYRPGMVMPTCLYCPTPVYTEEARETKLQGMVTLAVLVSADGRATDMRVTKGLGAGLDERAMQAVRGWRFGPARDPARRPVAAWVTIEAVFRLF